MADSTPPVGHHTPSNIKVLTARNSTHELAAIQNIPYKVILTTCEETRDRIALFLDAQTCAGNTQITSIIQPNPRVKPDGVGFYQIFIYTKKEDSHLEWFIGNASPPLANLHFMKYYEFYTTDAFSYCSPYANDETIRESVRNAKLQADIEKDCATSDETIEYLEEMRDSVNRRSIHHPLDCDCDDCSVNNHSDSCDCDDCGHTFETVNSSPSESIASVSGIEPLCQCCDRSDCDGPLCQCCERCTCDNCANR
jgi:hypothetical protein